MATPLAFVYSATTAIKRLLTTATALINLIEALPLDRVNRKGEGKPLALAMGQVTLTPLSMSWAISPSRDARERA
jgi:hypothetical protein